MKLKNRFNVWRNVFGNWKYVIITVFIAVTFYSLNVLISSWQNVRALYPSLGFFNTVKFFFVSWFGFKSTIIFHSFVSLIIISILFGTLISLILYKSKLNMSGNKKVGLFGGIGIFIGALTPGCVFCGIGLASMLGIGAGALAFLPYEGLELSVLSIGLLSFAILKISDGMYKCDIPFGKLNKIERR